MTANPPLPATGPPRSIWKHEVGFRIRSTVSSPEGTNDKTLPLRLHFDDRALPEARLYNGDSASIQRQ